MPAVANPLSHNYDSPSKFMKKSDVSLGPLAFVFIGQETLM